MTERYNKKTGEFSFFSASLAFTLAVLCVAILVSLLSGSLLLALYISIVAMAHGLLATPIFMYLNNKNKVSFLKCLLFGYLIGSLPIAIFIFPLSGQGSYSTVNDVATLIDGIPTLAGWRHYFLSFSYFGIIGSSVGIIFWVVLNYYTRKRIQTLASFVTSPSGWVTAGLIAFVILIPNATKDRSCHNPLRDGKSSIGPVLSIQINVSIDEWRQVRKIFSAFANKNSLSFKDSSESRSQAVKLLRLSMCLETGVLIKTNEQRWASNDFVPAMAARDGVGVYIYSPSEADNWQSLASLLIEEFEDQFPSGISFWDEKGHSIDRSETQLGEK